jgi:hypothetical protein
VPNGRRPLASNPTASYRRPLVSLPSAEPEPEPVPRGNPIAMVLFGLAAIAAIVVGATVARGAGTVAEMEAIAATPDGANAGPPGAQTPGATSGAPGASGSPSSASVAAPAPTTAPPGELDDARAMGLARLVPLGEKYPRDPAVLKALTLAYAGDSPGSLNAVRTARRLVELQPKAADDEEVRRVFLRAANGAPEATDLALDAMTHMGPTGLDLLYEIGIAQGIGKYAHEKVAALLTSAEVMKGASPALRIANDLRIAQGCKRKSLLTRARDEGDGRSLPFLKAVQSTSGCGLFRSSDCYGCFGARKEVNEAIEAINGRAKATPALAP